MAELLPDGTDLRAQPRRGHPGRYPWAEWVEGGHAWRLTASEDVCTDVEHFRRTTPRTSPHDGVART